MQTFGEFVFLYVFAEGCYHFMRLFFAERSGKPPPAKAADFFRSLFIYMSIRFNQQTSLPTSSLRTSDRCHWCGNPFSLRSAGISVIGSASGGRIATPTLRRWLAMTGFAA